MCQAIGHPVLTLRRDRVGPVRLQKMRAGEARLLGQKEVADLRRAVGLA
jgi:16S rRNA U516 pseudouridylate synthase RsuA-like enzyme